MKNTPYILMAVGTIAVLGGLVYAYGHLNGGGPAAGTYDEFAKCIASSGAKFYGAFWCPHCQNQKKAFGAAASFLPYVECSSPDGQSQTQVCADAKVQGYPTWRFTDGGDELTGEVPLTTLAARTKCPLPAASQTESSSTAPFTP